MSYSCALWWVLFVFGSVDLLGCFQLYLIFVGYVCFVFVLVLTSLDVACVYVVLNCLLDVYWLDGVFFELYWLTFRCCTG